MPYDRELALARQAAVAAGENAIRLYAEGISSQVKPDGTPVSNADTDNERLLREFIEPAFPNDGIVGEEGTRKPGASGRRWILDPIDGTRDFVRGDKTWCVLIALEEGGDPVLGIAHFPELAETYWASRGAGAFRNGERLTLGNTNGKQADSPGMADFLARLWVPKSYGGRLQAGSAAQISDVWYERGGKIWDLAPVQTIIEEAGWRYFAPDGTRRSDAGRAIACTPALESKVRAFLSSVRPR